MPDTNNSPRRPGPEDDDEEFFEELEGAADDVEYDLNYDMFVRQELSKRHPGTPDELRALAAKSTMKPTLCPPGKSQPRWMKKRVRSKSRP